MSSEFLIAVSCELPKQDNLVNKGTEAGKMLAENFTNNQLEEKLSLSVPEFSCIRNFPFNKNMKFYDNSVPNCTSTRKHTLDDELNTRLPKLIKLQPEYTNYSTETAVDMVDSVRSQVIKNDVVLGENLKNPSVNKNEETGGIREETSLQQLANETMDSCNSDNISEAIGVHCSATVDVPCTDRKASDQKQDFLKMGTESAVLQIQNRNESSASLVTAQDGVTETENLLLNTEKRAFYAHEFVGAETVVDEYHSVHESFSLSEFLICPTSFEQKESCDTLLHPVQEEEAGGGSATAASYISPAAERKDSQIMFQYESEMSGHACPSYVLDNNSVGKDVCDVCASVGKDVCDVCASIANPSVEAQNVSHSAEVGISSNLLHNIIPDSEVVTAGQTVVKEEFPIKQEVDENPNLHTIHVPSLDLLHNRELDLADETLFHNWFMSIVNQETGTESVSTSTYGHHESSDKGHTEDLCSRTAYKENLATALAKSAAAKEYSVEPHTKYGNEIIGRDLPPPDLTGRSGCVQVANHYADRMQSASEENQNHLNTFLHFVPNAPTPRIETSFEKVKNPIEQVLLTTPTVPRSPVVQSPKTNVQPLENKSDFVATAVSDVENTAKPESDIVHKHHKKELIKKFSSGLLEDGKCEMNSSQGNIIQTETTVKDSAVPSTSTSTAATNEDKCNKDCIVISDSDDDSIIEFDIVKTCTKKRVTKSAHGCSSGKKTQSSSRKSTRNMRNSINEESSGQQARNSSAILECIVVSDSDDESSKPALSSRKRASNHSEEGANISDAESRVSLSDINHRDRTESHGVIDLSGVRSPSALSKSNSAVPSAGDSSVGALATAFTAGDSQSSLTERLVAHNSGLDTNSSNTSTHIVTATITYNPARSSLGRESNGDDIIDLSRRNLTPLITSLQNKTNSAVDILDLSGSDKKQQERHSVITSVGTATENKSATKDIAEEKDSSPSWSCPICFESLLSGRQSVSSTPCGHVFCTKCIEEAVNQFKKCPTCCRKVALKRVHKIFL